MAALVIVGVLYLVSGAVCAARPVGSAQFLGLEAAGATGRAEIFAVYGGLQLGLGLAMLACAAVPRWREGGLVFAAVFSAVLLACRLVSIGMFRPEGKAWGLAALEAAIAVGLVAAAVLQKRVE